jgi:hypothetical protein
LVEEQQQQQQQQNNNCKESVCSARDKSLEIAYL